MTDFRIDIAGLDASRGLERFGDEKTFLRILRSYALNTKSLLPSIRAVDRGSLAEYTVLVHGLKGSSRNIFAMPLGAQAEALERAAKAGDAETAVRDTPAFLEAAEKLIRDIEAALEAAARANPLPRRSAPDPDVLLRLREACENYDSDEIDLAMEEIGRFEYDADGGLAVWLRDAALRMDFAAIAEKLASPPR